jgi:hypothetical protein
MQPLRIAVLTAATAALASSALFAASLDYATLIGGKEDFADSIADVAVDADGFVYVVGGTDAKDFPVVDALQPLFKGQVDAFVMKLTPAGEIVFSTYLGGTGAENASAVEVADNGEIFVAGLTSSADFPIVKGKQKKRAGASDAFVVRLAKDGKKILASTYLGGSERESRVGLRLGRSGPLAKGVYVYGTTESLDFPEVKATQAGYGGGLTDGFLTILKSNNLKPVLSTYAGGGDSEVSVGLALNDDRGDLYLGLFDSGRPAGASITHFQLGGAAAFQPVAEPKTNYDATDDPLEEVLNSSNRLLKTVVLNQYIRFLSSPVPSSSVPREALAAIPGVALVLVPCVPQAPATACNDPASLVLLDEELRVTTNRGFGGPIGSAFAPTTLTSGPDGSVAVIGDTTAANLNLVDPIQGKSQGGWETYLYYFADPLAAGPTLVTYYGGKQDDFSMAVDIGPDGEIWTGGVTFSKKKLTTTPDALRRKLAGRQDGYLVKIDPE